MKQVPVIHLVSLFKVQELQLSHNHQIMCSPLKTKLLSPFFTDMWNAALALCVHVCVCASVCVCACVCSRVGLYLSVLISVDASTERVDVSLQRFGTGPKYVD